MSVKSKGLFHEGAIYSDSMLAGEGHSWSFNLVAGVTYNFDLSSASEAMSYSLSGPQGKITTETLQVGGEKSFTPTISGEYEIELETHSGNSGSYTVTAGNTVVTVDDHTTGSSARHFMSAYNGPVLGLTHEYIDVSSHDLNLVVTAPNVFIHSGSGMDGLTVSTGNNILDGSTGSNFLIGGTGHDTFYMDDRNPTTPIFSTVVNFHAGDDVTVWGVTPTDFTMLVLDNQGAVGATGVDLIFTKPGHIDTSFVLAGYTSADLSNGRLSSSYGRTQDLPGLPGSQYLTIHAN